MRSDATQTWRLEGTARAAAAVTDQEHDACELCGAVVNRLFHLGLSLQSAADLHANAVSQPLMDALEHLADTIREIRTAVFATPTLGILDDDRIPVGRPGV